MLKKTMTYEDYNGVPRTEDFYFNLTPAEVTEMELSVDGGLVEMINRVVAAQDGKQIINVFKDIILRAYGEKSPDGKRFVKNQEIRDAFAQTNAYSDPVHGAGHRRQSRGRIRQRRHPAAEEGPRARPAELSLNRGAGDAGTCGA